MCVKLIEFFFLILRKFPVSHDHMPEGYLLVEKFYVRERSIEYYSR